MKINMNSTKFLDRETDLKHRDIITLTSEGAWEDSVKFKKDDGTPSRQFGINITLSNGEARSTTLSWSNVKLLVSAYGDETDKWVGKELRAFKTKSEKAKTGYVYLYVPLDWDRDETGEWIIPEGSLVAPMEKPVVKENVDLEEIKPEDIPF